MQNEKIIQDYKFFSHAELQKIKDLENQQIKTVTYHYWLNTAKKDEPVELLNYIEFNFIDNTRLILSASELCDSIEAIDVDIEEEKKILAGKFNGNISIRTIDKTDDQLWGRVIGYPVAEVLIDKNLENKFYSDKIFIAFLPVQIMISITPVGLHVEEVTGNSN